MKKIKVLTFEALEKVPPPPDADTPDFPDEYYRNSYQYAVRLLKAFYDKQIEKALKDIFAVYKNFLTAEDLSRYIIYKIEEYTVLPDDIKEKLKKRFEKLYKEVKTKTIGMKTGFSQPDIETIRFIDQLNDVYLGKFFQGDQKVRAEVLNWVKKYYFEEGNPIGKGQKGIKEFLNRFGSYLKDKSDHKIRQIIDTTVNFVKTAAQINAYAEANIKEFVWDAVNDRLTCPACRSMDGRIIKTEQAVSQLQEILNKGLNARPIITTPFKGKTENAPVKFPPLHPLCRCQTIAHFKKEQIPISIQRPDKKPLTPAQTKLEEEFNNLSPEEINNRIKAHQGSVWYRPPNQPKDKHIKNFLGEQLLSHFLKHGNEVGAKTVEEYKNLSYEIIKNPDEIYVERIVLSQKGKETENTTYIFYKDNKKVISSDDNLSITSLYKEEVDDYIKRMEEKVNKLNENIKKKSPEGYVDWGLIKLK